MQQAAKTAFASPDAHRISFHSLSTSIKINPDGYQLKLGRYQLVAVGPA
jgi:hypothetical protein